MHNWITAKFLDTSDIILWHLLWRTGISNCTLSCHNIIGHRFEMEMAIRGNGDYRQLVGQEMLIYTADPQALGNVTSATGGNIPYRPVEKRLGNVKYNNVQQMQLFSQRCFAATLWLKNISMTSYSGIIISSEILCKR